VKSKKKKKLDLKPIEMNTKKARWYKRALRLAKFPLIKYFYKKVAYPDGLETQTATAIPINESLGTYENKLLPFIVTEYFINKAGTILMLDCPCRTKNECKNHDVSLGCTYLGKGAGKVDLTKWPGNLNGRIATKEEALERERLAYKNGLIPSLGKLRGDAKIFGVVDYEHEFMSICHCCSCCCVASIMKYGPSDYKKVLKRIEGVNVKIDPDKCVGCGKCFKVCIFNGLKMVDDKTTIIEENCLGCGRCATECPKEAITVSIDDYKEVDELIANLIERYESRVDIEG